MLWESFIIKMVNINLRYALLYPMLIQFIVSFILSSLLFLSSYFFLLCWCMSPFSSYLKAESYRRAIVLNSRHANAFCNLGLVLQEQVRTFPCLSFVILNFIHSRRSLPSRSIISNERESLKAQWNVSTKLWISIPKTLNFWTLPD